MSRNATRIAVIGGIAVGKSSIVHTLSKKLNDYYLIEEDVLKNLFLPEFYGDMKTWAFHSRISTLAMITENSLGMTKDGQATKIIMDRCVDELITFAKMHYDKGNMSEKEFSVYSSLYSSIVKLAPPIDLFIYCKCLPEISLERITKRNRSFEQNIDLDYISLLNSYYDEWLSSIDSARVKTINTNSDIDIESIQKFILDYGL